MDETFNNLESAFKDLQTQNNQEIILSIDRFFAREIEVKVMIEDQEQKYCIYEDPSHQMLIVDSPVSGPYCYEWEESSGFWKSSTHQHFLEGFLVKEFLQYTNGFLAL